MSFLSQQLGEDELRHLLQQLEAFDDKCASPAICLTQGSNGTAASLSCGAL